MVDLADRDRRCWSTVHDQDHESHPPATVIGLFVDRSHANYSVRTRYCPACAAYLANNGWFIPDDGGRA